MDNKIMLQLLLNHGFFKLYTLKFFLQILWEINGIENKKYIHLSDHLTEVGKMLGGWIKEQNLKNQTLL